MDAAVPTSRTRKRPGPIPHMVAQIRRNGYYCGGPDAVFTETLDVSPLVAFTTLRVTVVPAGYRSSAFDKSPNELIALPLTDVITSPWPIPAWAAGPFGTTLATVTPVGASSCDGTLSPRNGVEPMCTVADDRPVAMSFANDSALLIGIA